MAWELRDRNALQHRHAGDGLRRLRFPWPACGAGAGEARLPHPRRGAPARPCRPSAAARPGRTDPRRAGQSALSGDRSRPRCATPTSSSTWSASCSSAARQTFRCRAGAGAAAVARGSRGRRAAGACVGDRRRREFRRRSTRAARPQARRRCSKPCRRPRSSAPRSCSGRRTISSTASPRWRGCQPVLPLIGGGETRFQPVFVGDVATAIADAVDGKARPGTIYELGGPEVRTFRQLMEYVLATIERRGCWCRCRSRWRSCRRCSCSSLPKPLLTPDQVTAAQRQRGVGGRDTRRAHACRARHRAGADGGDRAVLSLALPHAPASSAPGGC